MSAATAPAPAAARRVSSPGAVLAVASLGAVLAFVDATIVNVAFPDIRGDFGDASLDGLSWILNAYNIVFAAFLVAAGAIADLLGRRRLFSGGVVLFTLGSLLCALAPSVELLVAARIVQALGAAVIVPASLALVLDAYAGAERTHGVALWSASAALAAGIGPSLGGVLVELGGWRLAFLVNLPIGVAAFVLAGRVLVESRAPGRRRVPDLVGAVLLAVATAALTLAIVRGGTWGWANVRTLGVLALALALTAIFAWRCTWHRSPMLDLELLRIRAISVANLAMFVAAAGYFAYILCNVLFLTSVWGYSVLDAGLALTPGPFVAAAIARPAGRLADRIGERWMIVAGAAAWAAGVLYMASAVGTRPDFVGEWLPGMLILGVGAGICLPVVGSATVAPAPAARFATASGLSAVSRQLGAALGVALLVAIVGTPGAGELAGAFDDGWRFAAACFVLTALGAPLIGRIERPAEVDEALEARPAPLVRAEPLAPAPAAAAPGPQAAPLTATGALAATPVFAGVSPQMLERLVASAGVVSLAAGDWLFRQGDPGDALYVVVAGRLEVLFEDGSQELVNVKHPGSVIGELALLSGADRGASVRARRDSRLLRLGRAEFDHVLREEPAVQRALMAALATQLARSRTLPDEPQRPVILALVGLDRGAPLAHVARHLQEALGAYGAVVRVDAGEMAEQRAVAVAESAERSGGRVLLVADDGDDAWTAFCLRQADVVLGLGCAAAVPDRVLGERRLRGCDLLLADAAAGAVSSWVEALAPRRRQLLHGDDLRAGVEVVARRLAGRSIGLCLSGGGASGLAHLGVIQELHEAGVIVDRIAGVSFGAFVGALLASGLSPEEIDARCYEEWVRHKPLGDYRLPRHALIRGDRVLAMFARNLPGTIEELPIEFSCMAADLRKGEEVAFRTGPLAEAVAASMCLPGLAPPRLRDGRLLVDGVLVSALPVHLLSNDEGPIIAVDVTARPASQNGASPRAERRERLPGIGETLFRTALFSGVQATRESRARADLLIVPDTAGVGFLEFHQLDVAKEAGRRAAREALERGASVLV
jgi:EmrB/QacA subfamily drug resistance transporter